MSHHERDMYLKLCESNKVPVDQNILKTFPVGSSTSLDLSNFSITKETCEVLSKLLLSSTNYQILNLADCLLPPRGLAFILQSLSHVTCLTSLNLKGNNISGNNIVKLGHMISSNSSIKELYLEWNSLGLFPEYFKEFCSGLAKNSCLEKLDLQNNRLSPECALMLSDALACNNILKSLDLRWNEVGWQGGQYIHEALQNNNSLTQVQLQGNRLPGELLQTIEQCASHNLSRSKVIQECSVRNHLLTKHVRRLEAKRALEIESLTKQNEEIIKETEIRLSSVEEVLNERTVAVANGQVQIKLLQTELRKKELICEEHQNHIKELEDEKRLQAEKYQVDLEKNTKKYNEDLVRLKEHLQAIEDQLSAEKGKNSESVKKLMLAENEVHKLQAYQNGLLEIERKQYKEELDLMQRNYEVQSERAQKDFDENIKSIKTDALRTQQRLTERISVLESSLFDLEKKLSEQSAQVAHMSQELARSAENTALAVQETKEKEMARIRVVEDSLETARDERLKTEKQLETAQRHINNLQEQNNALIAELGEPQRKIAQLHEELSNEREIVTRLRVEKNEEVARADFRKAEADKLQLEVNASTRLIGEIQNQHKTNEQKWNEERDKLLADLQQREKEIQRMRSDEIERAAALYSAFTKYLRNVHPSLMSLAPST